MTDLLDMPTDLQADGADDGLLIAHEAARAAGIEPPVDVLNVPIHTLGDLCAPHLYDALVVSRGDPHTPPPVGRSHRPGHTHGKKKGKGRR